MKKTVTIVLLLTLLMTMVSACGESTPEPTEPETNVKLWYAYNTENLMQSESYPEKMANRDSTLRMYGIRGDVESIQLMITPDEDVAAYEFEIGDLTAENGEKIAEKNIEVFAEWYVNVEESYNTDSYYGYYPDALVPMRNMKKEGYNSIKAGENQGIWINVEIPEKTNAGLYTGVGTLEMDGKIHEIPVELTVYDAVMPETVHPQSCFLIWYHYMEDAEGAQSGAIAQAYFDLLVEKRCMPMYPSTDITGDYEKFVNWVVENAADNPKISTYALPYTITEGEYGRTVSGTKATEILTMLAEKNIALRQAGSDIDLFDKAYFYLGGIIDEPSGPMLHMVRECDLTISQCKLAVADAYLKDYPDLYQSLVSVPHVVTTAYDEELLGSDTVGGVQTFCPQFQHWHSEAQRAEYHARQASTDRIGGEEAWWYGCNNPMAPFPTYHLDDDMIASRVLSWMQYEYDCDGNLYWCVNNSKEEMWETADAIGGAVCEGNLTYPAKKFKTKEPLSTLRLESIREGMEDYEYFWMIEQAITAYNAENGRAYDPQTLMDPLYDGLYNGMIPVRNNAENFHNSRLTVLDILQTMTRDPAAGIAALEGMSQEGE